MLLFCIVSEKTFGIDMLKYEFEPILNASFQKSEHPILDVDVKIWEKTKLTVSMSQTDVKSFGLVYRSVNMDVRNYNEYVLGVSTSIGRFQMNYLRNEEQIGLNYTVRFTL